MAAAAALAAPAFFVDPERGAVFALAAPLPPPPPRDAGRRAEAARVAASVRDASVRTPRLADAVRAFVAARGGAIEPVGARTWRCHVPGADPVDVLLDTRHRVTDVAVVRVRSVNQRVGCEHPEE